MNYLTTAARYALIATCLFACSGATTDVKSDAGGLPANDGGATDDAATDDASVAEAGPAKPATPTITGIMAMGGMHLTWTLNDTGLSSVELWRKQDQGAYAKAYTLAGTAVTKLDSQASTASSTYCYQVLTVRNGVSSDLSNEECGSP